MRVPFPKEGLVAFGPRGQRSAADLWSAAHRLARALPRGSRGRAVLLVFEADRFLFAAALLATWARGLVALIPPDNRRATLTKLQHLPEVTAILHDTESGLPQRVQDILQEPESMPGLDPLLERLEERWRKPGPPLVVCFSGVSRGEEARVALSGREISAELARLDACPWPERPRVAGSAPIGHRYGLVHTVLRPLALGGAFFGSLGRTTVLAEALDELRPDVLVSHPHELAALSRHGIRVGAVVSGGSRLDPRVADRVEAAFGVKPLDLFTTSAEGALASRLAPDDEWRCLPQIELGAGANGVVFLVEGRRLETGDRLVPTRPGRFESDGRHERRAIISGATIDLDRVESRLAAMRGVADAAAHLVDEAMLVAVAPAESTDLNIAALEAEARRELPEGLSLELRVAPSLPRDGLGRISWVPFHALFARGPDGAPRSEHLSIREADVPGRFEIEIPDNYRWFDGHFDQYPVMPAAVQLRELVVPCARRAGLLDGAIARFERLKFNRRIQPGMTVEVRVEAGRGGVRFELLESGALLSSGRLVPAQEDGPST